MLRRVTVRYIKIHDVVLFTSQIKTLFTMNSYDLYVYDKFIPCDADGIPQQCCTSCCLFFSKIALLALTLWAGSCSCPRKGRNGVGDKCHLFWRF